MITTIERIRYYKLNLDSAIIDNSASVNSSVIDKVSLFSIVENKASLLSHVDTYFNKVSTPMFNKDSMRAHILAMNEDYLFDQLNSVFDVNFSKTGVLPIRTTNGVNPSVHSDFWLALSYVLLTVDVITKEIDTSSELRVELNEKRALANLCLASIGMRPYPASLKDGLFIGSMLAISKLENSRIIYVDQVQSSSYVDGRLVEMFEAHLG